jgi:zinc-ribbon domain
MPTGPDERARAIEAADRTCPRCGAPREPEQRFCLECGLALPNVEGTVPELRRRWLRRFGWYPGDWVWISLLTLLVAAAGAAAAIALTVEHRNAGGETFTVSTAVSVAEPTAVPTTTPATVDTSTLPTAPEPTTTSKAPPAGPKNGRYVWPRNENGWTIVLVSYPKANGRRSALSTADRAASSGLHQVGILDSTRYASLQPGYLVVFTGIYGSRSDADSSVSTARQAGFSGAYSRQIAR